MYCIFHLVSHFCISCVLRLTSSFTSFLAIFLIRFLFSLEYSRSACFSLYIISFDKQLYIKIAANQYKCLIWHCQIFYALYLCLVSCALRFLPYLSLYLLPHVLSSFRSSLSIINQLIFFSIL